MKTFYVYVLKNKEGKIYIGQTDDLARRVEEHNDPDGHGYTSKYQPWVLVYQEELTSRQKAMGREKYLKTGVGREWIRNTVLRA